MEKKSIELN